MRKIGLTGGIGSGKTTVARMIRERGYPVYDSDAAAARIVNEDKAVARALADAFGEGIRDANGMLDRPRLATRVFNDPTALARVNGIVHPAVVRDFNAWCDTRREALLFLESAILFESGLAGMFDAVITVVADEETRVERVMRRDGVSREKVMERARHQAGGNPALSRFVIYNNPGDALAEQVSRIINTLETWQDSSL
ncbi:MAG: dephospho-CoA kinase [Odoribacteraceae bacterium]|jgi:dephospho-CoA kinase|nr:dephospho-CoA kinase [Odoribacteraceae bacterium]